MRENMENCSETLKELCNSILLTSNCITELKIADINAVSENKTVQTR